jgi:SOS regulatory protein LexA
MAGRAQRGLRGCKYLILKHLFKYGRGVYWLPSWNPGWARRVLNKAKKKGLTAPGFTPTFNTMKATDLTRRQQAVLKFIRAFVQSEGRSPTLTEIAKGVGSSAVSTIHKHVQHLMDKGFLVRSHGKGNNLVVATEAEMEAGPGAGSGAAHAPRSEPRPHGTPLRIFPFCGDVAAGSPILPESRALPIEVPNAIHRQKDDLFVLRVRGDSMVDDAILDGDLVVLQRKGEYRNGDRIVALIDQEEVTLKELRRDAKGVWLIPHNAELQPRCYSPQRIDIQGALVGVMRSC